MSKTKTLISDQLVAANLAITNTLIDPEIQGLVAVNGYTAQKMNEGKGLYEAARAAVTAQVNAAGAQYQARQRKEAAKKAAEAEYQAVSKVSKAVFQGDKVQADRLGLSGEMPIKTSTFIIKAFTVIDNALNNPDIKEALAAFGFGEEKLRASRGIIAEYESADQAHEACMGAAQQATVDQNTAIKAMTDWTTQYLKIARVALRGKPQLLEKIGVLARTSELRGRRNAPDNPPTPGPTPNPGPVPYDAK